MFDWLNAVRRKKPAAFEVGRRHPTSPPGRLEETVAQVFDGTIVVTLWVDRSMEVVVELIKRRIVAIGVWDGGGASCGLTFGVAADDLGGMPMIGCVLPRLADHPELSLTRSIAEVVLVTADHASREVQAVVRFELPADVAEALHAAMCRQPGGFTPAQAPAAADMWRAGQRWVFEADDAADEEAATDFTRLDGRFRPYRAAAKLRADASSPHLGRC